MGLTYSICANLSRFFAETLFSYRAYGHKNLIEKGPALMAMNHQSFLDPPLAGICSRRQIYYLARKTLLDWPGMSWLLPRLRVIPVDQDRADMAALKTVIRILREGHCTVIFPEGSRTDNGQLQVAAPGIGLVIAKTLAPVIPMRIFGAYEAFPRGAKSIRRVPITVVIGKPIRFTADDVLGDPREVYRRLSATVMDAIAALENPRED